MWPYIILFIAVLILIVLPLLMFVGIGRRFMQTVRRPESADEPMPSFIDISFYQNSPHRLVAEKGLEVMKTLPHEDVFIQSEDGLKLHAAYFPAPEESGKVVLGIHGFRSKAWHEYAPYIEFYHALGYSMLLPDDRAHGQSEGDYIGMGVLDRRDCISWAKYLVERFGKNVSILMHGVSMGGAAVLSASGEEDLPPQVQGIISDCGYTSFWDQIVFHIISRYKIPTFPVLNICEWYAKHYAGYDFHTITPLKQVTKAKVPILFVQGEKDFMVPAEMAQRLYEACTSRKRLLMVPEASHAESIALAPEEYHQAIKEFFNIG